MTRWRPTVRDTVGLLGTSGNTVRPPLKGVSPRLEKILDGRVYVRGYGDLPETEPRPKGEPVAPISLGDGTIR
jgi:hypothetical protein